MNRLSVRARLTLWNVGVLAFILVALGVSVRAIVHTYLLAGIDNELTAHADALAQGFLKRMHRVGGVWVPRDSRDARPPMPRDMPRNVYAPRLLDAHGEPLTSWRGGAWDRRGLSEARRTRHTTHTTVTVNADRYRVVTAPILPLGVSGDVPGFIQLAFRFADIDRGLHALDRALLTLLPLSLLVAGAGGAVLTGRALRPVRDITLATDAITAHNLSGRLPVSGTDEFGELSRRFNNMLERLDGSFARQRRFVADASHELKTPLAIIAANASLALDDEVPPSPGDARRAFLAINGAAERMNRIVRDLLLLAQSETGDVPREHSPVVLGAVLTNAAAEATVACRERGGACATLTLPPADAGRIADGDRHYLLRVFVNLLENALRHTPPSGTITASLVEEDGWVTARIADTGSGIAPEHLPHLFDRFYRVDTGRDRGRGGTGLGLSIVRTLVGVHEGTVSVESAKGVGTVVSVRLPRGTSK